MKKSTNGLISCITKKIFTVVCFLSILFSSERMQAQIINFTFNPDSTFAGIPITFNNTSTGFPTGTQFIWNFGDPCMIQQDTLPGMSHSRNDSICNDTIIGLGSKLHTYYMPVKFTITLKANYNGASYQKQVDVTLTQVTGCPAAVCDLIGNGGFEDWQMCPDFNYENLGQNVTFGVYTSPTISCWYPPTAGTPDHLINIAQGGCNVNWWTAGNNLFNCQTPHNGSGGMVGLHTYYNIANEGREYIQEQLLQNLVVNNIYRINFFAIMSQGADYQSPLSVAFTQGPLQNLGIVTALSVPTIAWTTPLLNSGLWPANAYSFLYTATGGEDHITFGNFRTNANTTPTPAAITPNSIGCNPFVMGGNSYVLLDDVSLVFINITTSQLNPCDGNNGTATVNINCGGTAPYTILWSTGSNTNTISSLPAGVYTVTVTDASGLLSTNEVTLINYTLPTPTISGSLSGCLNNKYEVSNLGSFLPGTTFSWTCLNNGSAVLTPLTGTFTNINWSNNLIGGIVVVTANYNGCSQVCSLYVQLCCSGAPPPASDITLVDPIISNGIFPGNGTTTQIYINGTMSVFGTLSIANCPNIRMAPGSRIIVKAGATLNISNSSLYEGCNQMWEGIIEDPNAVLLRIYNGTRIRDANNAVYSLSTGTHLKVTYTTFNKNYIGINLPGASGFAGTIQNNLFTCSNMGTTQANLIAPYAGQIPTPGTKSLAGIQANDFNNLTIRNCEFSWMASGIVANGCNLTSDLNFFKNIGMQGGSINGYNIFPFNRTGIYAKGSSAYNICNINGIYVPVPGNFSLSDFENCNIGINSISNILNVHNNGMSCIIGIYAVLSNNPNTISIYDNAIISSDMGITAYSNTGSPSVDIGNNQIFMNNTTLNSSFGILTYETSIPNLIKVHDNRVDCAVGQAGYTYGIISIGTIGAEENNNLVHVWGGSPTTHAFENQNCQSIYLHYNHATGLLNYNTGFNTWSSPGFVYECNRSTTLDNAFTFNMDCSSPQGFKGNLMESYSNGLTIDNNGSIGNQDDRGNLWCVPGVNFDASCINGSLSSNNKFKGAVGVGSLCQYNPVNIPNFSYTPSSNLQYECSNPYPTFTDSSEETLTEIDYRVANDSILSSDSTDAIEWVMKRNLYEKLYNDSTLVDESPIMKNFKDSAEATTIGNFSLIQKAIKLISDVQPALQDSLLSVTNSAIIILLDSINHSRELMDTTALTYTDSLNLANVIGTMQEQLSNLSVYKDSLVSIVSLQVKAQIDYALQLNDNVQTQKTYENNERMVNNIYLESFIKGLPFTAQQEDDLVNVANQCPVYGGNSVFLAQGMYIVTHPGTSFDNYSLCLSSLGYRQSSNQIKTPSPYYKVNIFPTIVHDVINVQYFLPEGEISQLDIKDVMGKIVGTYSLAGHEQQEIRPFDLSNLSNGIYYYLIRTDLNIENKSGKFIISK